MDTKEQPTRRRTTGTSTCSRLGPRREDEHMGGSARLSDSTKGGKDGAEIPWRSPRRRRAYYDKVDSDRAAADHDSVRCRQPVHEPRGAALRRADMQKKAEGARHRVVSGPPPNIQPTGFPLPHCGACGDGCDTARSSTTRTPATFALKTGARHRSNAVAASILATTRARQGASSTSIARGAESEGARSSWRASCRLDAICSTRIDGVPQRSATARTSRRYLWADRFHVRRLLTSWTAARAQRSGTAASTSTCRASTSARSPPRLPERFGMQF